MKRIEITFSNLWKLMKTFNKACCSKKKNVDENGKELMDEKENVISRVLYALVMLEMLEQHFYGSTDDAYQNIRNVLDKMEKGELVVFYTFTTKELKEIEMVMEKMKKDGISVETGN